MQMWISLKVKSFSQMRIMHRIKEEKLSIDRDILTFYYPYYFVGSRADESVKMKKLLFPTLFFVEFSDFSTSKMVNWVMVEPYIYFVYNSKFKYSLEPETYRIKDYEMKKFMKNCSECMSKKEGVRRIEKDDIIKVLYPSHIEGYEGRVLEVNDKEVWVCLFDLAPNNKWRLLRDSVEYVDLR